MDTEHKANSEHKTDSVSSGRSSSCEKSLYDDNSEFSMTDPSSDGISEAISETISPLRGGSNCEDTIKCDKNSTAIGNLDLIDHDEKVKVANDVTNDVEVTANVVDYSSWDIVGNSSDMLLLNQPDVTLSATKSTIVVDSSQPGPSGMKSCSRKSTNSPSDYLTKIIEWMNRKVPIITQV